MKTANNISIIQLKMTIVYFTRVDTSGLRIRALDGTYNYPFTYLFTIINCRELELCTVHAIGETLLCICIHTLILPILQIKIPCKWNYTDDKFNYYQANRWVINFKLAQHCTFNRTLCHFIYFDNNMQI